MSAYNKILRLLVQDTANRVAYLGYHGEAFYDYLTESLTEDDLASYLAIVNASDAAGFDPFVDRRNWSGCNLPRPESLPRIHEALEVFVDRFFPDGRLDPAPPLEGDIQGK